MRCSRRTPALAAVLALASATAAAAHQTAYDKGVAVTTHVAPDDEPVAGRPATVVVTAVRVPKGGRFEWKTCACRLRVTDASGTVVYSGRISKRVSVTFPQATAYQLVVSGRYRRNGRVRSFRTVFAIRADSNTAY